MIFLINLILSSMLPVNANIPVQLHNMTIPRSQPSTTWSSTNYAARGPRLSLRRPCASQRGSAFAARGPGADLARLERLNRSEEPTSELPLLMRISYAGFCLKKNQHYHTQLPAREA